MHDGLRIAEFVLLVAGYVAALFLIPKIILERRQPAATMAWVLAIALLPIAGIPLYFLVGERRIRRHLRAKIDAVGAEKNLLTNRIRAADLPDPVAIGCSRVLAATGAPPPVAGNRVSFPAGGQEAYGAVLDLIAGATDHIHAQFFILDVDPIGKRFIHALAAKARSGVRVRLLLDAVGSWRALRGIVRPLREAGGEVAGFLPANPLHRKGSAHLRNHRKLLIADGRTAFTGGMNIGSRYMGPRARPDMWRDSAVLISGAAVGDLQSLFLDDWAFATEDTIPAGTFYPSVPPSQAWPGGTGTVQVVASGPDRAQRPIYQGLFAALTSARRRIWIATPYFVPDDATRVALGNAALRGVDVRLVVPGRSDLRMVALAGRSYFEELMGSGVRIGLYRPTLLHSKILLIDEAVAVVGSSNVDVRSFFLNFELGLFLYGEKEIKILGRIFARDLADAPEISPEEFSRRGKAARFIEDACRILSPLL